MKKLIAIDIKRLFQNKASVILTLVMPVVLALLFALLLAPVFFTDTIVNDYYVVIWNEDDDPLTSELLDTIIKNDEIDKLTGAVFVQSEQEALQELKNGATAYIHLPSEMQKSISKDEPVILEYMGNPDMPLEDMILTQAMDAAADLVNFTQNASAVLSDSVAHTDEEAATTVYRDISRKYFYEVMNRKGAYTRQGKDVTPFDGLFPLEYYTAALLVLFIALGGIPVARTVSDNAEAGLVHRQLLCGNPPVKVLLSKWLSGSVFLLLQFAVLCAALLIITRSMSYYAGSFLSLLSCGILLCTFTSALQILIGLYSKTSELVSMAAVICLAALGGLFISASFMPKILGYISVFTPLSLAHRLAVTGMFRLDESGLIFFAALLVLYTAVMLGFSYRRMVRRTV